MTGNVYLAQMSTLYGSRSLFLPYSVGLLQAYAQTVPEIRSAYAFKGFLVRREPIAEVVARLEEPAILGLSCYLWNWEYSKALAAAVKQVYPRCLIVMGGPQVPNQADGFFNEHPYVDLLVHGEGEAVFAEVLSVALQEMPDFTAVAGITVHRPGSMTQTAYVSGAHHLGPVEHISWHAPLPTPQRARLQDLSEIPSPYMTNLFDKLLEEPYDWNGLIETNRGCPYTCLAGDTPVHTVYGKIPIAEVARRFKEIGVFTFDAVDGRMKVATARNIRLTGRNRQLVRVHFSDRTHIDCTPDHRFLAFKWSNQHGQEQQWECEAKDLQPGIHVRAMRRRGAVTGNPYHGVDGRFISQPMNHVVEYLESLPGFHDVYCLEVPTTGWFFANNVLVHNCTFCVWGDSALSKFHEFPEDRLLAEIDWFGQHRIRFAYAADANFGIVPRDVALTEALAQTKARHGYPQEFRACTAKNSGERIFEISKILHAAGMHKGATLSLQSLDAHTLQAVKRTNIKMDDFAGWMRRYREAGISTYTELILGLPGETYESFTAGIDTLLEAGQHEHINIYMLQLLPNSEMADPAYMAKHGIKTRRMPQLLQHSTPGADGVTEYQDIVIETATMPLEDWKRAYLFAWAVQTFHCLGLLRCVAIALHALHDISYSEFYGRLLAWAQQHQNSLTGMQLSQTTAVMEEALTGGRWDVVLPDFSETIWPTEEASFLVLAAEKAEFYQEIRGFLNRVIGERACEDFNEGYPDLLTYQREILIDPRSDMPQSIIPLRRNWHTWLAGILQGEVLGIPQRGDYHLCIRRQLAYAGDLERYAREIVWYGRKGGAFLHRDVEEQRRA